MKATLLALLLFLAACSGCGAAQLSPTAPTTSLTRERAASVQISALCAEGISVGSGVAVSKTQILTAKHVALCNDGAPALLFVTAQGVEDAQLAIIQGETKEDDGALLQLVTGELPVWLPVSLRKPAWAEEVCWVGQDGYQSVARTCGVGTDEPTMIAGHVVPGNSGSGIVLDGHVIGVVSRGRWFANSHFVMLMVPTSDMPQLLEMIDNG